MKKRSELMRLFWPIFWEILFCNLINVVDVAMVSSVGDDAVGAVGASGTYLMMINSVLMIVSVGAQAIMSRQVGAGKPKDAHRAMQIGVLLNSLIGAFFTAVFFFGSYAIHGFLKTSPALLDGAATYLKIVGSSCVFLAVTNVLSAYLRSFGNPRATFVSGTVGNVLNLILNAVFLKLGHGVAGVAMATFVSRAVTMLLSAVFALRIRIDRSVACELSDGDILRESLKIGVPAAGEGLYWSVCVALVMFFLNQMDGEGAAVKIYSYVGQIVTLIVTIVTSFERSSAIVVGWHIGAKDPEGANAVVMRALKLCAAWVFGVTLLMIPLGRPILSLLTDNESILSVVPVIMTVEIVRELGRTGNCVIGSALKTAGDAMSTLTIAVVIMPTAALVGSYFLGIRLGLGAVGAFIGLALDEGARGVLMFFRWRSRKWEFTAHIREKDAEQK